MARSISRLELSFFKWSGAGNYASGGVVETHESKAVLGRRGVGANSRSASFIDALYELLRPAAGSAVRYPDRECAPYLWIRPGLVVYAPRTTPLNEGCRARKFYLTQATTGLSAFVLGSP